MMGPRLLLFNSTLDPLIQPSTGERRSSPFQDESSCKCTYGCVPVGVCPGMHVCGPLCVCVALWVPLWAGVCVNVSLHVQLHMLV